VYGIDSRSDFYNTLVGTLQFRWCKFTCARTRDRTC